MDWQVALSRCKLTLYRDLRWVAKQTRKFPHKYMYMYASCKKNILRQTISLANNRLMDVTQLALTWVG